VRADAQRGDERHVTPREGGDGGVVEVVEVIVRDEHGVELGQLLDAHRRAMKALRAGPLHRRDPVAPHRIGEHADAVDLDPKRCPRVLASLSVDDSGSVL